MSSNAAAAAPLTSPPEPSFWSKPATVWDGVKVVLPLLLLFAGWVWRTETRIGLLDQIVGQQAAMLQAQQQTNNERQRADGDQSERLARIEVGLSMLREDVRDRLKEIP